MAKLAIVVFSDTTSMEALGKISNAFVLANEAFENGDDLKKVLVQNG